MLFSTKKQSKKREELQIYKKSVLIRKNLQVFLYANKQRVQSNIFTTFASEYVRNADKISDIVESFSKTTICYGIDLLEDTELIKNKNVYKDAAGQWRHNLCPLITNNNQCLRCKTMKKLMLQHISRLKTRSVKRNNSRSSYNTPRVQLLQRKIRAKRCHSYRYSQQVSKLKNSQNETREN